MNDNPNVSTERVPIVHSILTSNVSEPKGQHKTCQDQFSFDNSEQPEQKNAIPYPNQPDSNQNRMQRVNLLLLGDFDRTEFREISRFFDTLQNSTDVYICHYSTEQVFFDRFEKNPFTVDFFLFLEEYSGQYPPSFWNRVRKEFPLATFLLIAGALCQGEERTGSVESGIVRLSWFSWTASIEKEIINFINGKTSLFSLGGTAFPEDRIAQTDFYNGLFSIPLKTARLGIIADDPDLHDLFSRFFQQSGKTWFSASINTFFQDNFRANSFTKESTNISNNTISSRKSLLSNIDQDISVLPTVPKKNSLFAADKNDDSREILFLDTPDSSNRTLLEQTRSWMLQHSKTDLFILVAEPNPEDVEHWQSIPNCRIVPKPFWGTINLYSSDPSSSKKPATEE